MAPSSDYFITSHEREHPETPPADWHYLQNYIDSPNDMQVDSDDFMDGVNEKDDGDVAIINPDEAIIRADNCTSSASWLRGGEPSLTSCR